MFNLFRRHQKVLLTGVAVLAIGSMAFSAIAPIFIKDQTQTALKKTLIQDPKQALIELFNCSFDGGSQQVVFPEPLLTHMVLETDLYKSVYERHSQNIDNHLDELFSYFERYEPQEVIQGSSYHQLAAQISPKMGEILEQMRQGRCLDSMKKLELLTQFFQQKLTMPSPLMYQYLKAISKNQVFVDQDQLCFFGLKTPTDFFGSTLIDQSATCLLHVLKQEAGREKPQVVLEKLTQKLSSFYQTAVHPNQFFIACGLDPQAGLEVLKYYEAFKHFKQSLDYQTLLDPLTHLSFSEFAEKKIPVLIYRFDSELAPKTLEEACSLELFCRLKEPLVFDQYELKIRCIDKSQAIKKLPKKQQYMEALNCYDQLCSLMPYELSQNLTSDKERLEAIKSLKGSSKECLEAYIQKTFVQKDPTFFQKILLETPVTTQTVYLSKTSGSSPLSGFGTGEQLKQKLDLLPFNTPVIFDAGELFVYQLELTSKQVEQKLTDYAQALSSGLLKVALKNELEPFYKEVVKKSPAKWFNQDKKIKSLDECYLELLELKAADLKDTLASMLGVDSTAPSTLVVKAYPKMILTQALEKNLLSTDFRIKKQASYVSCKQHQHRSFVELFNPQSSSKRSCVIQTQEGECIYEKTGPQEQGPLLMDKTSVELLAEERFKSIFNQKVAGFKADV